MLGYGGQDKAKGATAGDSTVQELEQLAGKAKSIRSRFEPVWYTNVAYYQGQQWLYYNRGRLQEPKLDPWRVTFTDNRLIGIVRTEVAKLTKQRPVFVATPMTGAEEDVEAARLSERILRYQWKSLQLQRKQRAALMWSRTSGSGFWKVCWDSSKGEKIDVLVGPDGQPVMGNDGRPLGADIYQSLPPELQGQIQVKTIAPGDVSIEVRSPFEMLIDPLAGDEGMGSAEWMGEQVVQSVDYVKDRYGVELPEDTQAIAGLAESRMTGGMGDLGGSAYKGVLVSELWFRPCSRYPKGKRVVWAGKKILVEDDQPYDECPYVMFTGIPVPGRFWPTSIVEQLRVPQAELNKTRSQIRENAARIGNPSLLKSRMSDVEYHGVPGEVIEFNDTTQNAVPSYLQPPEMPSYVIQEIDRIEQAFREISGQHEVTAGTVPAGVTAASAINLLQEQDDTRMGPDVADMEAALAEAGQKVLRLVAKFYNDQRTIRIAGDDGDWDIFEFKGAMLRDSTQVEVQAGSAFPASKAAKQAAMQQLLTLFIQNGMPLSRRELSRYLKDMEVGGMERLIEQLTADEAQVNSENRKLAMGMALPLNSYDDDEAHIDGHEEYQKSVRYQRLPPPIQMLFEQHVGLHKQRVQQAMEEQMRMQVEMERAMNPPPPAKPPEKKAA